MSVIGQTISISAGVFLLIGGVSLAGEMPPTTQGQTVYVPVYSKVPFGDKDSDGKPDIEKLSALLLIRNKDLRNSLTVRSIRYYDGNGKLIREYSAGKIAPLGTLEAFVEQGDQIGGSGAKFLVVWDADKPVNAPIIETVHAYFMGNRSITFTSPGQPLHTDGQ
jgi:hypothetical protein